MQQIEVRTSQHAQMIEITSEIQQLVGDEDLDSGSVMVFVPHTTAGITINENADPDVVHDMLAQLEVMVPWKQEFYRHGEGNSASHVKASMMGSSVTVIVENGKLQLGTWQGIWFCEFDGPRNRKVWVRVDRQ
jgi:secondary thiamine-phosphate synthase enzyme